MVEEGLMAGINGSPDVAPTSADVERDGQVVDVASSTFAWLTVGGAAWIVGGFFVILWAVVHGQAADPALSVYIIPLYLGLAVLAAAAIALAVRASRQGRGWRRALPPGYGVLAVGVVAVIAGFVADVGWREGVENPEGVAGLLAPTRLLMVTGLVLVAVGPLRSAMRIAGAGASPWPAVLSSCLVLAALYLPGGFHPVTSQWLERAPVTANGEIWVMDGDGAHQTRLIEAHDGIVAWNPVWSPDGKRIAYTRLRQGDRPPVDIPDEADIWVAAADGSNAHALVEQPDWQWLPHWSPDGVWIAYTDEPEAGPWATTGSGGLGGGGFLGTGIGFGASNPVRNYADIWRIRADGTGSPERLTDQPGDDRAAAYSPDGTKLAFDSTRAGGTDIFVMNSDGSDARQLTFDHAGTWGATWSPDGRRIAFNAWRPEGNQDIYTMDPDGSHVSHLTNDPADDIGPSWSPDGKRIAFRRLHGAPDGGRLLSIASGGGDERELSRESGAAFDLTSGGGAWAADGRIVFFRGESPPASAHPLVREDLAAAGTLLTAILLAFMAVLLARIEPPFGGIALLVAGPTALFAALGDQWRFIPAALAGGLIADVLVRFAPERRKVAVAGAASAGALVLGAEVTVAATGGLGWSPSLLSGVLVAAAALGWGLGEAVGRPRTPEAEVSR
jgi:Tol biopolymer transport system component